MPNALVPLASFTLTSNQSSVVFSGIPSNGFRDLRLVSTNVVTGNGDITFRFNGDNGANYSRVYMFGNGSGTSSGYNAESYWWYGLTSDAGAHTLDIFDYSATDRHKTVLARGSIAGNGANATVGRWASTAAITSITINISAGAGATFNLFGVIG